MVQVDHLSLLDKENFEWRMKLDNYDETKTNLHPNRKNSDGNP